MPKYNSDHGFEECISYKDGDLRERVFDRLDCESGDSFKEEGYLKDVFRNLRAPLFFSFTICALAAAGGVIMLFDRAWILGTCLLLGAVFFYLLLGVKHLNAIETMKLAQRHALDYETNYWIYGRLLAIDEHENAILEVHGEIIVASVGESRVTTVGTFSEFADDRSVDAVYRDARKVLTPELARRYVEHLAADDDELFDAEVKVSALARIAEVADDIDRNADKLAERWFVEQRKAIKNLSDERQASYREIKGMSRDPQQIALQRPRTRSEDTEAADGQPLPTRKLHLMSDDDGDFPVGSLNDWELRVLDAEMQDKDFLAWYRNPSRASDDALAIAYRDAQDHWRRMCPDFVFFHGSGDDIKVSIVDPHGHHLADALPKLRGLAEFADHYGDQFHRIEAIARLDDGKLRLLDLHDQSVRHAINGASDAKALYLSNSASDY